MIDVCLILGSILGTNWISRLELNMALKIAEADFKASGESPCHNKASVIGSSLPSSNVTRHRSLVSTTSSKLPWLRSNHCICCK